MSCKNIVQARRVNSSVSKLTKKDSKPKARQVKGKRAGRQAREAIKTADVTAKLNDGDYRSKLSHKQHKEVLEEFWQKLKDERLTPKPGHRWLSEDEFKLVIPKIEEWIGRKAANGIKWEVVGPQLWDALGKWTQTPVEQEPETRDARGQEPLRARDDEQQSTERQELGMLRDELSEVFTKGTTKVSGWSKIQERFESIATDDDEELDWLKSHSQIFCLWVLESLQSSSANSLAAGCAVFVSSLEYQARNHFIKPTEGASQDLIQTLLQTIYHNASLAETLGRTISAYPDLGAWLLPDVFQCWKQQRYVSLTEKSDGSGQRLGDRASQDHNLLIFADRLTTIQADSALLWPTESTESSPSRRRLRGGDRKRDVKAEIFESFWLELGEIAVQSGSTDFLQKVLCRLTPKRLSAFSAPVLFVPIFLYGGSHLKTIELRIKALVGLFNLVITHRCPVLGMEAPDDSRTMEGADRPRSKGPADGSSDDDGPTDETTSKTDALDDEEDDKLLELPECFYECMHPSVFSLAERDSFLEALSMIGRSLRGMIAARFVKRALRLAILVPEHAAIWLIAFAKMIMNKNLDLFPLIHINPSLISDETVLDLSDRVLMPQYAHSVLKPADRGTGPKSDPTNNIEDRKHARKETSSKSTGATETLSTHVSKRLSKKALQLVKWGLVELLLLSKHSSQEVASAASSFPCAIFSMEDAWETREAAKELRFLALKDIIGAKYSGMITRLMKGVENNNFADDGGELVMW